MMKVRLPTEYLLLVTQLILITILIDKFNQSFVANNRENFAFPLP